jgi:hypothetical protein
LIGGRERIKILLEGSKNHAGKELGYPVGSWLMERKGGTCLILSVFR